MSKKRVKDMNQAELNSYCQMLFDRSGKPAKRGPCKGWSPVKSASDLVKGGGSIALGPFTPETKEVVEKESWGKIVGLGEGYYSNTLDSDGDVLKNPNQLENDLDAHALADFYRQHKNEIEWLEEEVEVYDVDGKVKKKKQDVGYLANHPVAVRYDKDNFDNQETFDRIEFDVDVIHGILDDKIATAENAFELWDLLKMRYSNYNEAQIKFVEDYLQDLKEEEQDSVLENADDFGLRTDYEDVKVTMKQNAIEWIDATRENLESGIVHVNDFSVTKEEWDKASEDEKFQLAKKDLIDAPAGALYIDLIDNHQYANEYSPRGKLLPTVYNRIEKDIPKVIQYHQELMEDLFSGKIELP